MSSNPTKTNEWNNLEKILQEIKNDRINDYFLQEGNRAQNFSQSIEGLFFDYSKNHITQDVLDNLLSLVKNSSLIEERKKLFDGQIINKTENKPALHTSLRNNSDTLKELRHIVSKVREEGWFGATGKPVDHIVHIGLGGSELGPRMLFSALEHNAHPNLSFSFVANVDGADIENVLRKSDPETTLFIVVSKSFTTQETLVNAETCANWVREKIDRPDILNHHFIGITANVTEAQKFGLSLDNIIRFDDAVNGRFSLWSSVSLSICIAFGIDRFREFLHGAQEMDTHFRDADLEQNIPIIMAMIDIWHRNFWHYGSKAVIPYAQELSKLPAYLQQLEMESNGKNCDLNDEMITEYSTVPVIFGEVGTNSQHSFFQMLHQGTDIVPCDFIGAIEPNHNHAHHHTLLLNNMLAQSQSLMQGQSSENRHLQFNGNRPSTTILLNKIDAYHLGMLIALYEHKVFVQSVIWNINCFDQFGVQLGKDIAKKIEHNEFEQADNSTINLHRIINQKENME